MNVELRYRTRLTETKTKTTTTIATTKNNKSDRGVGGIKRDKMSENQRGVDIGAGKRDVKRSVQMEQKEVWILTNENHCPITLY